MDKNYQQ